MWRNKRQFTRMCDWLTHILFWMSLMPLACNVCWAWLFVLGDMGMNLMWSIPREEKAPNLGVHFPTFTHIGGTIGSYLTCLRWPRWCLKGTSSPNGPEPFSDTFDLDLAKSSSSPTAWGRLLVAMLAAQWREGERSRHKKGQTGEVERDQVPSGSEGPDPTVPAVWLLSPAICDPITPISFKLK